MLRKEGTWTSLQWGNQQGGVKGRETDRDLWGSKRLEALRGVNKEIAKALHLQRKETSQEVNHVYQHGSHGTLFEKKTFQPKYAVIHMQKWKIKQKFQRIVGR